MTLVVNDTFTETSDTNITSHTGETGATWATHPAHAAGGTVPIADGGVDELHTGNTASNQYIYASGSPANADWKATITFRNRATAGNGAIAAVYLRMSTSAHTGYGLFYFSNATPFFRLYKWVAGTPTQIGSDYTYTLPASEEDWDFYVVGSAVRVYDSGGTLRISATDSDVTAAGRIGIRFSDYATPNATGGVNISRIQGWDGATLPATPVAASDTVTLADSGTTAATVPVAASDTVGFSDSAATTVSVPPPATLLLNDTLTPESTGMALESHAPDGGGTWSRVGGTTDARISASGRAYPGAASSSATYEHSATIADGLMEVAVLSGNSQGGMFLGARKGSDAGGYNVIFLYIDNGESGHGGRVTLSKRVLGTLTELGTYDIADWPWTGAAQKIRLRYLGSDVRVYALLSGAWTEIITATISDLTTGVTGVWFDSGAGTPSTSNLQLDYITVTSLTAGAAETVTVTETADVNSGQVAKTASDTVAVSDISALTSIITPRGPTPSATEPAAYGSRQTVQTADIQNAPCGFCETLTGKLLYIYNPSAAHAGSGSIAIRSAASEADANAGTFTAAQALDTEDATWYYSPGGLTTIQEGANAGRVWASMNRAAVSGSPKALNLRLRYTDNPDAATPTWSSPINISAPLGDGTGNGDGSAYGLTGVVTASRIVEIPGTGGQTLLWPVWTYDGSNVSGYVRVLRSTDGGATWAIYSTVAAYNASYDTSEAHIAVVTLANGARRLLCTIVYISGGTATINTSYSDDDGATWSAMGTALTNATASPSVLQLPDGSVVMLYRNLADSEHTWMARSTDYGATFPVGGRQVVDSSYRMRYGDWWVLQSGRLGLCYGTESDSTHAGIYWRVYTLGPYASGGGMETFTLTEGSATVSGTSATAKTASDTFTVTDTAGVPYAFSSAAATDAVTVADSASRASVDTATASESVVFTEVLVQAFEVEGTSFTIHPQGMVPGTAIGAYLRWEWRGPVAAKLNAGPGAVVKTTTVGDDLTATFAGLDPGEYVAYSADYPSRRMFFMVTE